MAAHLSSVELNTFQSFVHLKLFPQRILNNCQKEDVDLNRQKYKSKIVKLSSEIKFSSLKIMKASISSRNVL